ncbi:MAG TPA: SAM-dependent methyltransferase, partial [Nonomuraea sp.]|nr:SAM-dependent methyltransferase [Nonomuraea sp.]
MDSAPDGVDPSVPNIARMYDYFLDGKDNFAADRAAAEQIVRLFPDTRESARANRAFLRRAVRHLVES